MVRQHRTTAAVIIASALAAGLAPAASADPQPLAHAETAIAAPYGAAPVRPNPDNQLGASAPSTGPCSEVCSAGARSYASLSAPRGTVTVPPAAVRVVSHPAGFHWGDAAIGAGVSLVLVAIGLTGVRAAASGRRGDSGEESVIVTG